MPTSTIETYMADKLAGDLGVLRERQTKTEANLDAISSVIKQISTVQVDQQRNLNELGKDTQSILDAVKAKEGRVDLRSAMFIVVPVVAFLSVIAAMYVAPINDKIAATSAELQTRLSINDKRWDDFEAADSKRWNDFMTGDSIPSVQIRFRALEDRVDVLSKQTDALSAGAAQRLQEEAAVGRKYMRGDADLVPLKTKAAP